MSETRILHGGLQVQILYVFTYVYTTLLAVVIGYRIGCRKVAERSKYIRKEKIKEDVASYTILGLVLCYASQIYLSGLTISVNQYGQWTGAATVFYFISTLKLYALGFSLYLYLSKYKRRLSLILLVLSLLLYFDVIFFHFRRRAILEFILIFSLMYVLVKGRLPNKFFLFIFLLFSLFVFLNVMNLRGSQNESYFDLITLAFSGSFSIDVLISQIGSFGSQELVLVLEIFRLLDLGYLDHQFGIYGYNGIIGQLLPSSIMGIPVKTYLLIDDSSVERVLNTSAVYEPQVGLLLTSFSDTFIDFWFFGVFYFYFFSFLIGRVRVSEHSYLYPSLVALFVTSVAFTYVYAINVMVLGLVCLWLPIKLWRHVLFTFKFNLGGRL